MKLVYFAWVREKIGKPEETITLPDKVVTVSNLLNHLKLRDENYAEALKDIDIIRVAVNHNHVEHDAVLSDSDEVALFPPMTGG